MNILVACEYSGRVREAMRAQGHKVYSCDLLPSEDNSPYHIQADVRLVLARPHVYTHLQRGQFFDRIVAHPDCTFHTNASVRWFTTIPKTKKPGIFYGSERWTPWKKAIEFFQMFQQLVEKHPHLELCIENPIMHKYSREHIGPCTQIVQPWQFGHKEMKATCLWLYNLPKLQDTDNVGPPPRNKEERRSWAKVHMASPGPDRWKLRSRTYPGIANAMAEQWG